MKYTIDYAKEDLIEIAVKEWVLAWVKKYNPEVFDRAREWVIQQSMKDEKVG
jgi:hypothetical protein